VTAISEVHRVRPYRWGAIYAFDSDEDDFPEDSIRGDDRQVWGTPHWITIGVRHAFTGDVPDDHPPDAPIPLVDVESVIRIQDEAGDASMYDEVLHLPSGVLNIGDANESEDLQLRPGHWRVQINLDPLDEATRVEIVLSPLDEERSCRDPN
jgi:hypothetical protein